MTFEAMAVATGEGRLRKEEACEADELLWDDGNNDTPFVVSAWRSSCSIRTAPPRADLLSRRGQPPPRRCPCPHKDGTPSPEQIHANIRQLNPKASVLETVMPVTVDHSHLIEGKRVLVIEDGSTFTHGGMSFGAGVLAAKQQGAREFVDPRAYAVRTIQQTFIQYPHIGSLPPAMGFGATQVRELEEAINRIPCDVVLIAAPVDSGRIITIKQPTCRVTYRVEEE
jgi:predicted GTPase